MRETMNIHAEKFVMLRICTETLEPLHHSAFRGPAPHQVRSACSHEKFCFSFFHVLCHMFSFQAYTGLFSTNTLLETEQIILG